MVISLVLDMANGSIRLYQGVLALNGVTVSFLCLLFNVTGVVVLYAVIESVLRVSLREAKSQYLIKLLGEVELKFFEKSFEETSES